MLESPFNKIACLKAWNIIKKIVQHSGFPVNFAKFLRTPSLKNICKRLLLETVNSAVNLCSQFCGPFLLSVSEILMNLMLSGHHQF